MGGMGSYCFEKDGGYDDGVGGFGDSLGGE